MIAIWLLKHRMSLLFLLALLTLGGLFTAFKLPVLLFPNIDFPRIEVLVDSGDRPADRMIIEVTQPLEETLRSIPGVKNVRSDTTRGSTELSINFDWNTNMVIALLQVQAAINQLYSSLPLGTTFSARRMDPIVFPVYGLSLTSKTRSLVSLRDFAYFQLRPYLSVVPGVSHVELQGGQEAEFQVLIDPAKLRAANITLVDVINALNQHNKITAVGRIEDNYHLYLILSDARLRTIDDLKQIILRKSTNGIIDLDDVSQVVESTVPHWTKVRANGQDAVLINVFQQPGANTVSIVDNIKNTLSNFKSKIPNDIQISSWYDQSQLIRAAAISVKDAIVIGVMLAIAILILFLRNIKMTIIVAIILPCVLVTAILLLYFFHMGFNIMTLGGMAAAVGLIIDDGVVMLEHIMRRLSEGHTGETTHGPVMSAAMQMSRPLIGSSLATVIIFLPLAFMGGIVGGFFIALAITMAASLIISFFYVFLIIPLLGEFLLKITDAKHLEKPGLIFKEFHLYYQQLMNIFLEKKQWIILTLMISSLIGFLCYKSLGSGFMPTMDEGGFVLDYIAPPGTSLTETDRLLQQVEQIITQIPEVESYSRRTGLQLSGGITEANTGDFFIQLKKSPRREIHSIMAEVRDKINLLVPGLKIETAQLMEDMIGDLTAVPQPIEIKIFGDNQLVLQQTAKQIAKLVAKIKGVVEIKDGIVVAGDAIEIRIDPVKAALFNLDPQTIINQISTQLMGAVVSKIQLNQKMVGVRVWSPEVLRDQIQKLSNLPLQTADAHYISLQSVAKINFQYGQAQITRENLKMMVAVTGRIEGRDMGSTMRDIKQVIDKVSLPPNTYIQYGGLYQEQQKSSRQMLIVFFGAVLLISVLLLFLYENFQILISILITALLSLMGVFLGLLITHTELNLSSMMGMTMIIGIVTEMSIFYFSELNSYTQPTKENIIVSGIMRMRPILMTTIIAMLALLPLALGIGGSSMQQPLAIAIISGLIFGLPFVLILMPAIYSQINQFNWSQVQKLFLSR